MPPALHAAGLTAVRRASSDSRERFSPAGRWPLSWRRALLCAAGLTAVVLVTLSYAGPPGRRSAALPSSKMRAVQVRPVLAGNLRA